MKLTTNWNFVQIIHKYFLVGTKKLITNWNFVQLLHRYFLVGNMKLTTNWNLIGTDKLKKVQILFSYYIKILK